MICPNFKVLFIDIVRTGGTSVCQVLKKYGGRGKHHSIGRTLPRLSKNRLLESPLPQHVIDDYFSFTFVRNPYDRLISLYSYCQTASMQVGFNRMRWKALATTSHKALPKKAKNRTTYWPTDFPTFVEWLVDHDCYYCDFTGEKYIPMKDWIVDDLGTIKVSFIGRHEYLQQDFDVVMQRIFGITTELGSAK